MRKFLAGLLAFGLVGAFTVSAWAFECPARKKDCDAAIAQAEKDKTSPPDVIAKAKKLCEEGWAIHTGGSGNHKEAVAKLKQGIALVAPK